MKDNIMLLKKFICKIHVVIKRIAPFADTIK